MREVVHDSAPERIPKGLANLPDPTVQDETPSRTGNRPYEVFGRSYDVMSSSNGYAATGNASWYGTKFHGRTTSSGEPYDMFQLTAAHRSLPLPTFVRVTNLDNDKQTIVRVNDRGPFHPDRIIDLSYAAAVKLGFAKEGTARVRVEALSEKDFSTPVELVSLDLKAGPFETLAAADSALLSISSVVDAQGPGVALGIARDNGQYFVRIGPMQSRRSAERLEALLAFRDGISVVIEEWE